MNDETLKFLEFELVIVLGALFIAVLFLFSAGNHGSGNTFTDELQNKVTNIKMNAVVDRGLDDEITLNITRVCGDAPIELQPECVMKYVDDLYNYTENNDTIRTPDEYVSLGGDCSDITVLYGSVFRKMGWSVDYVYPVPGHIRAFVRNEMPCNIDNQTTDCWIYCDMDNHIFRGCSIMEK